MMRLRSIEVLPLDWRQGVEEASDKPAEGTNNFDQLRLAFEGNLTLLEFR